MHYFNTDHDMKIGHKVMDSQLKRQFDIHDCAITGVHRYTIKGLFIIFCTFVFKIIYKLHVMICKQKQQHKDHTILEVISKLSFL